LKFENAPYGFDRPFWQVGCEVNAHAISPQRLPVYIEGDRGRRKFRSLSSNYCVVLC
jgi:hypothetical protein